MEYKEKNILVSFIVWHFYEMPKLLFSIWNNYLWFGSNFFSIPDLLSTLLSPWRKYYWPYPKGFHPGEFFANLISNSFSRFVGMLMRIFLIILGIVCEVMMFFAGIMIILIWLIIPFILILLLLFILTY